MSRVSRPHAGSAAHLTALLLSAAIWWLAAPLPGAPPEQAIDQLQVCLDCHDLEEELSAEVAHEPAAGGDCTACHNPHVSRFAGLLLDRPGPLCVSCHGELAEELALDVVHAPVGEGLCVTCHRPHGGA